MGKNYETHSRLAGMVTRFASDCMRIPFNAFYVVPFHQVSGMPFKT